MMIHDKYPKVTIDYLYPSEWRKCCKIKTGRGVVRETVKQRDIRFVQETFGITVNDDIADAIGIGRHLVTFIQKNTSVTNWET
jgi:hypothetical protein